MIRSIFRAYRDAYRGLPRPVWLLAVVFLINRSGTMVLPFLALYLTRERGFSPLQAGNMLAIYGIGAIAGAYVGGWLSDRVGSVHVIKASLVLSGPGFVVIPQCDSMATLIIALLYLSLVAESARPASITATTQFAPTPKHPRALALNRLALNLGMSIGPAVGGYLAVQSFLLLFWINGIVAVSAGLAMIAFFRRTPSAMIEEAATSSDLASSSSARPRHDARFMQFMGLQFLLSLVFFQFLSTLPLYWKDVYRLDESWIGFLMAINTIVIVLFEMVLTDRMRRFRTLHVVAAGALLTCLGFGLTGLGTSLAFAALTVMIWTMGEMLVAPFAVTYVASRSGNRERGAYMGVYSIWMAAGSVFAPLIGTALYQIDPQLPWRGCLGLAAVLLTGFLWIDRPEGSPEPVPP